MCWSGGTGRRTRLKISRSLGPWGFDSPLQHHDLIELVMFFPVGLGYPKKAHPLRGDAPGLVVRAHGVRIKNWSSETSLQQCFVKTGGMQ